MKIADITDPTIASNPYSDRAELEIKISKEKWANFIDLNSKIFMWHENTKQGKSRFENLEKYPEPFKSKMKKILNKTQAMAFYSDETGKHDFIVEYIDQFGTISTTFHEKVTKTHLQVLLDMANYLDAYLLNHGREIIDEKFIETLQ